MKSTIILLVTLLSMMAVALHLGYDPDSGQLTDLTEDGYTRHTTDGTLKAVISLPEHGWVYASPSGNYLLLAKFHLEMFPLVADLRFLDSKGNEVWSKQGYPFASARLSDDGKVATVEFLGTGPQSVAELTLLDANGATITTRSIHPLGEYHFSPDGSFFAYNVPGDGLVVLNAETGKDLVSLPSTQVFALTSERVISAQSNSITLHDLADGEELTIETGVNIPRFVIPSGNAFVVAGRDDLFVVSPDDLTERYTHLSEGYSIASLDATGDFSLIAIGTYTREGSGAIWLYDGELNQLEEVLLPESRLGGPTPQVVLSDGGRFWVKTPDEVLTLEREVE
ncbi:hypothetical protein K8R78_06690 [bacterium]|nr:hypothetical protein [bacterium]